MPEVRGKTSINLIRFMVTINGKSAGVAESGQRPEWPTKGASLRGWSRRGSGVQIPSPAPQNYSRAAIGKVTKILYNEKSKYLLAK
jgi:hypothetical protein